MVSVYPQGSTPLDRLQADLKRKAAQLDQAENEKHLLRNELASLKASQKELEQSARQQKGQSGELAVQLERVQALLKQRDAALVQLNSQLDAARSRPGSSTGAAPVAAAPVPRAPLSRHNSDVNAQAQQAMADKLAELGVELGEKEKRIASLEEELAEARGKTTELTPRRIDPRRRESIEESGMAVVGSGAGMSAFDANRMRTLRAEAESWKDRSESLMGQVRELQRQQQATDIEKAQLADSAAALGEKCGGLEQELKAARDSLAALRAVADQGRGSLKSELQRKESDLGRALATQDAQAALIDELKAAGEKAAQEQERLRLQAQQLQAQLAKKDEEGREGNLRLAQLQAALEERTQALEVAQEELRNANGSKFSREAYLTDLQDKLTAAGKAKAETEAELRKAHEQLAAAQDTAYEVQEALKGARERAEAADLSVAALKAQLAEAKKEADAQERSLQDAAAEVDAKRAELAEAQAALAAGGQGNDALLARIESLQTQLEAAKAEVAAKGEQLHGMSIELREAQEEAASKARAAEEALAALKAGQAAMDRSKTSVQDELADLKEGLRLADARAEGLEAEIESRDAELAVAAGKLAQMAGLMQQVDALNKQVADGEHALKMAGVESSSAAAELLTTRQTLAERQASLENAHAAVAEKERKIAGLEMDLRQAQAAIATVEKRLQDAEERMLEQERAAAGGVVEVADLKTELRTSEMARQDLQRDLDAARLEVVHLTGAVKRIEGELEAAQKRIRGLSDDLEEAREPFVADQDTKRQLAEVRAELAAERSAHDTTKQALKRESEQHEVVLASAVAAPAAAAAVAVPAVVASHPISSPGASADKPHGSLSPREAAEVRQQVLDLEGELTSLQLAEGERQLAAAEQEAAASPAATTAAPAASAAAEEEEEEEPLVSARTEEEEEPLTTAREMAEAEHEPAASASADFEDADEEGEAEEEVSRQAAAGGRLEEQLNSSAVWRPRFLTGAYIHLRGVYLGHAAPRVTSVKVVPPADGGSPASGSFGVREDLSLDCSFAWSSRMEVKLLCSLLPEQQAQLQRGHGLLRQIGVKNMAVRGSARLTLAPLLGELPVVGAARVSLLGMPAFSYETTLYGGNIFALPGLEAWINSFIRSKVLAPMLFPQSTQISLPGGPPSAAARESRTLSPEWRESFTLIVHSTRYQALTLVLYDSARPAAALAALPGAALRGAAAVPAAVHAQVTGSVRECLLHVRCSFSAFTREEVEAAGAASAGRPGIVTILRRLSRQSKVPGLLRSGVLHLHLERAEGLASKAQAGFTTNFKLKISVGPSIQRVTERGKVDFLHKRNPVFDESLELVVDGDTAGNPQTLITVEIWSSHFVRKEKYKGKAVVPLHEVQRRRRLRGSWALQDAPPGASLTMELSWTAAAGMY
ncbi:kinesin K39 [Chlorella sorokiniana]|uniref:Kinesin K39 n=1 Tax=Chlorella sorokiniana TaxID=3076 RepID=A0A2P6TI27_CHLSO|nr:kinesin K39 [Chlorella sorokiniana]|eukprot:PRW33926.1 kinesin K39 [Chlorella sorokiniana]